LTQKLRLITGLMRTGTNHTILFIYNTYRLWNEENKDYEIKRAQIYMLQGFIISGYVIGMKTIMTCIYH